MEAQLRQRRLREWKASLSEGTFGALGKWIKGKQMVFRKVTLVQQGVEAETHEQSARFIREHGRMFGARVGLRLLSLVVNLLLTLGIALRVVGLVRRPLIFIARCCIARVQPGQTNGTALRLSICLLMLCRFGGR